jgi:hypothetical protein
LDRFLSLEKDTVKLVGGRNAMKIVLKAGARGWIETQIGGLTLIRFAQTQLSK